jgi:chromate transporter
VSPLPSPPDERPAPGRLAEVAAVFLRLGATAFGGPLAHLALMR